MTEVVHGRPLALNLESFTKHRAPCTDVRSLSLEWMSQPADTATDRRQPLTQQHVARSRRVIGERALTLDPSFHQ